jgi:Fe2+ or Zn2+ uptake regulation protein
MIEISQRQQQILLTISQWGLLQSSDVHARLEATGVQVSAVTIKRELSEMVRNGVLTVSGVGRSTSYNLTSVGRLILIVDPHVYCAIDPDKRYGQDSYNFDLMANLPPRLSP